MKALDESWPFVPELHLFHSRYKADKFIRRHFDKQPRFLGTGAQTWCEDGLAVVLITTTPEANWHADAALLCHEAYHVVSMHYDYLGEENPSEEFVAYGIQVISKALFEAHDKWKSKRIEDEADARDLLEAMRDDDGVRYSMDEVMDLTRKDAETLGNVPHA